MKNQKLVYLTHSAVIAALYAVLTIAQNNLIPGSASAAIQFRVAEVLCVLAIYTPAAIPGLTVGCIIANISSVAAGLGMYDMIFGSLASLLAALAMYGLRRVRWFRLPIPALLMPALFNAVIVGFEIAFFFTDGGFTVPVFLTSAAFVAIGELAVLFVLGLPFTLLLDRNGKKWGITAKTKQ